jgi:hypothetical protein
VDRQRLKKMLNSLAQQEITVDQAMEQLKTFPYQDLGFARIDHHRSIRCGFPEVIFCEGKKPEHVAKIFRQLINVHQPVLGTRANYQTFQTVKELCPDVQYFETARCLVY